VTQAGADLGHVDLLPGSYLVSAIVRFDSAQVETHTDVCFFTATTPGGTVESFGARHLLFSGTPGPTEVIEPMEAPLVLSTPQRVDLWCRYDGGSGSYGDSVAEGSLAAIRVGSIHE